MARIPMTGAVAALLFACGPTPPDYDALGRHRLEVCGETFGADELVRRAYAGESSGSLPAEASLPSGTVAVSTLEDAGGEMVRRYPCAEDEADARRQLSELGYRSPVLVEESPRALVFDAIDTYGIASTYSILVCDFVGEVLGRRAGSLYHQGLFGTFGDNGGNPADDDLIRDLATITYATGMTGLAEEGYARLVEGITLVGSKSEIEEIEHPSNDGPAEGVGVCVTWVEPNLWGGCDAIRVGISKTIVLDREDGDFHQLPIHSLLDGFYGFAGWCGRRE